MTPRRHPAAPAAVASVEVCGGPGAGRSLPIPPGGAVVVGRGADLSIEDPTVSRRHVELAHGPEGVLVRDLSKGRGVLVNGRPVPPAGALVAVQAVVTVGPCVLRVVRTVPSGSVALGVPGVTFEEKLGEGLRGEVWSARQDPPGRRVAVKVLASDARELDERRVRREALLSGARLDHPAIVRVHELLEHEGRLYLVRELVEGTPLDRELARGPMEWRRAARLGAELAAALVHAHGRGVVHRDVKPANVIVEGATGRARLTDFDVARDLAHVTSATRLTGTNEGFGTPSYVAPEQMENAREAGPPADVYGLAGVLFHAFTGERPFARVVPEAYFRAVFLGPPPLLDELAPHVPEPLRAIVREALAPEPRDRPRLQALRALLERAT